MPDTFTIRWGRVLGMAAFGVLIFGMLAWAATISDADVTVCATVAECNAVTW